MRRERIQSRARQVVKDERGSSVVETALVLPLFFFLVFVSIQFALIFMQDYGAKLAARDTVRWVAINPDTTDATAIAYLDANLPPNIAANSFTTVSLTPACASLTAGHCSGRTPGSVLTLQVTYDISNALILPTTYGIPPMTVTLPTSLAPYQTSVMIE